MCVRRRLCATHGQRDRETRLDPTRQCTGGQKNTQPLFRELREEELRKGREATNTPNTQTLHNSITHGPRKPSPLCPRGALPYRLGLLSWLPYRESSHAGGGRPCFRSRSAGPCLRRGRYDEGGGCVRHQSENNSLQWTEHGCVFAVYDALSVLAGRVRRIN